jgi:hypothetical protein
VRSPVSTTDSITVHPPFFDHRTLSRVGDQSDRALELCSMRATVQGGTYCLRYDPADAQTISIRITGLLTRDGTPGTRRPATAGSRSAVPTDT